jgi:RimJ/RimL family protein N-acetyltransferase
MHIAQILPGYCRHIPLFILEITLSQLHGQENETWHWNLTSMTNILETPRLLLRYLVINDLDDLFALYQDSQIRKYFPEGILNYQDTKEELEWHMNGHPRHPELGLWATIHKETRKIHREVRLASVDDRRSV